MASVLKLSMAVGLFGLVALAAILSWYFAYSSAPQTDFYFEGTDDTGSQIRLSATGYNTLVDFEILATDAGTTSWKLYRSAQNYAEVDPFFGFYNINSGDAAWTCTKIGNGNIDGNTNGAATFSQLGSALNTQYGDAGGVTYFKIIDTATGLTKVIIPVAFSSAGVTNFGGYKSTLFQWATKSVVSFKTGLPALPSEATCVYPVAGDAGAVVESATTPLCTSFPSLFAFLQKKAYSDSLGASTYCTGSATAVSCGVSTMKTDTMGWLDGKDRAITCTSATYGKIISFSGSDDVVDWLRNVMGTRISFNGMMAHSGFQRKFSLWQTYVDANASAAKTTFNGHSLGGAVANLAAVYFKAKYATAVVAIVTCGAPASFTTPHTAAYTGLVNKRYVNFLKNPWYLPNQRDVVSVVSGVLGFAHPSTAPILYNTKDAGTGAYSTAATSVTAIIGDVDVLGMHLTYTTSMDNGPRATQTTY